MDRRAALGAIVAIGAGAGAVTGCSASSTAGSSDSSGAHPELVLIQRTTADAFDLTMGCGARAEANKLGYSISVQGPARVSASAQIRIVNSVIVSKPAAVLIAPADRRALIASIQSMKSAGIKVIQVDTPVDDSSIAAQEPYQEGIDGVQQAVNAINGKPTKRILTSPTASANLRQCHGAGCSPLC